MPRIEDLISARDLQNYIAEREYPAHLGETLFPNKKSDITSLRYVFGANHAPVSASIRAVDAETQVGGRQTVLDTFEHDIFTIARKIPMTEKFILELSRATDTGLVQSLVEGVFNDLDNMVEAVRVRIERMRMDVLFNGKLEINENGFQGEVDYKVPEDHQVDVSATAAWGTANGDWIKDLEDWKQLLQAKGVVASRILTTGEVVQAVIKDANTLRYIGNVGYLTENILNDWLYSVGLPTFATYEDIYGVELNDGSIEQKKYVPSGKLALFGSSIVGETQFGITAEEVELRLDQSIELTEQNYIIGAIERQFDPVQRWTKAVARALPSFSQAHAVIQAQVLPASV